jgi:phosphoglycerate dehydrogenase-like enzyme
MLDDGAVPQAIGEAVAVVGHRVSAEALRRAQRLRLVHCTGAGIDGIAVEELPPGAVLCNVHEHEVPIAEYVMMGVLMMACRVQEHAADLRRGRWTGSGRVHGAFHDELYGKTVGLIGFGRIGREVAQRARAFGMRVLALRRVEAADPLLDGCFTHDRLHVFLGSCDVVVLCCPLTNQTRGMLGGPELAAMRPTAILVNPARAQIVDEQALFEALRQRRIKGAVLDVWYQYPAAAHEAPAYGSRLPFHKLDNVLPTPHLAAWTEPMFERRMRFIAANLDRFVRGEPLAQVVAQGPQPGGRSAGLKETS